MRTRRGDLKTPGVIYDLEDFFAHVRALAPQQVVAVEHDIAAHGYSMTVTRPDGVRGVATIRLDPEDVYEGGALMDAYRTACAAIEPAPPYGDGGRDLSGNYKLRALSAAIRAAKSREGNGNG